MAQTPFKERQHSVDDRSLTATSNLQSCPKSQITQVFCNRFRTKLRMSKTLNDVETSSALKNCLFSRSLYFEDAASIGRGVRYQGGRMGKPPPRIPTSRSPSPAAMLIIVYFAVYETTSQSYIYVDRRIFSSKTLADNIYVRMVRLGRWGQSYIYVVGWGFLRKNAPDKIHVRMTRVYILHICCRLGLSSTNCARQNICKNGADMDRKPRNAQFPVQISSWPDRCNSTHHGTHTCRV